MSLGATLLASFLVTLARPATWPLALVSFLLRGGLILVVAPIVVIPSAVGLANVVAPLLTSFVFGGVSSAVVAVVGSAVAAVLLWAIVAGLAAAAAEAEGSAMVAADEDVAAAAGRASSTDAMTPSPGSAPRILAARLIAHAPTAAALAWGAVRIVSVAYRELTLPSDVVSPLVVRVARGAPEAIAAIVIAWLVGEAVGALAARRVALRGDGVAAALRGAVGSMARRPVRVGGLVLVPLVALLAVLIPVVAVASVTWEALRDVLATGAGFGPSLVLVAILVAVWGGGLALIAVVSAWRAAVWTVDAAGTFGAVAPVRQGDWNDGRESGTLSDLRPGGSSRTEVTDDPDDRLQRV